MESKCEEKKKFLVECTLTYNGCIEVTANNIYDAVDIVQDMLNSDYADDFPNGGKFGLVDFNFSDATADNAYESVDSVIE